MREMVHADVNDLLLEKLGALNRDDLNESGDDVKSVRALQSKQDKLERDMGPIDTNVGDLRKTAEEVCKYFPHEKPNVSNEAENFYAFNLIFINKFFRRMINQITFKL